MSPAEQPSAPPVQTSIRLRQLRWRDPWRWLHAGARDLARAPGIGLFYGLCFVLMGWTLLAVFKHAPAYTLALSAGFLLLGPFLCLGLYQVSLRLERGQTPRLWDSLCAWRAQLPQLALFGGVLLVLEMLWGRAALVVFAVSFDGMPDLASTPARLLDPDNLGFIVAYLAVGALFAGLIYGFSVVAIPMLLDRPQVDAITAALTSARLVLSQTGVMLLWAALIAGLALLALLPAFLGLLVVAPLLGHASWHAYRGAVMD